MQNIRRKLDLDSVYDDEQPPYTRITYSIQAINDNIININGTEFKYIADDIHHLILIDNQLYLQFTNFFVIEYNNVMQVLDDFDYLAQHTSVIDKIKIKYAKTSFPTSCITDGVFVQTTEDTIDLDDETYRIIKFDDTPILFNENNIYYHVSLCVDNHWRVDFMDYSADLFIIDDNIVEVVEDDGIDIDFDIVDFDEYLEQNDLKPYACEHVKKVIDDIIQKLKIFSHNDKVVLLQNVLNSVFFVICFLDSVFGSESYIDFLFTTCYNTSDELLNTLCKDIISYLNFKQKNSDNIDDILTTLYNVFDTLDTEILNSTSVTELINVLDQDYTSQIGGSQNDKFRGSFLTTNGIHYKVNGVVAVIRCYSKTKIEGFKKLLISLSKANYYEYIFVIDRIKGNSGYKLIDDEKQLVELINTTLNNGCNYKILLSKIHYNGTGSFNIAFNYIRKNSDEYKMCLFHFIDDDDILDINKANLLISYITNNKEITISGRSKRDKTVLEQTYNIRDLLKLNDKVNKQKTIDIDGCEYNLTRAESDLYFMFNNFSFNTSHIINISTCKPSHLYEYMDTTDCNLWSFLWSPIYYKDIYCRLIPFGREDMSILNALIGHGVYNTNNDLGDVINSCVEQNKVLTFNDSKYEVPDFVISNKLIRINGLFKLSMLSSTYEYVCYTFFSNNTPFDCYKHTETGKTGSYVALKNMCVNNESLFDYMNNHQACIQHNIKRCPAVISLNRNQRFYYNIDTYGRDSNNYGIKYISDTNGNTPIISPITNFKQNSPPDDYEPGKICNVENTYGEYYIATYRIIKISYDDSFAGSNIIMFMSGRNLTDLTTNFTNFVINNFKKLDKYCFAGSLDITNEITRDTNIRQWFINLNKLQDSNTIHSWNKALRHIHKSMAKQIDKQIKSHDEARRICVLPYTFGGNPDACNKYTNHWLVILKILMMLIIIISIIISTCVIYNINNTCNQNSFEIMNI